MLKFIAVQLYISAFCDNYNFVMIKEFCLCLKICVNCFSTCRNFVSSREKKVYCNKYTNGRMDNCRYLETMMHLFKGNVGSGIFALGDAFKNAGLMLAPPLTIFLGVICVHAQHILVRIFNYNNHTLYMSHNYRMSF